MELKVPPLVVVGITAALMWLIARLRPAASARLDSRIVAVLAVWILIVGAGLILSGVVSFRRALTTVSPVSPDEASSLVMSGAYRVTRNPMYVGMAALLAAWAVYLRSPLSAVGVVGFVWYIDRFQIQPEERILAAKFGSSYDEYRTRVRRWL